MIATAEIQRPTTAVSIVLIWHLMSEPHSCVGECDFHAIVCGDASEEGIVLPGPVRDVAADLSAVPDEEWCAVCFAAAHDR